MKAQKITCCHLLAALLPALLLCASVQSKSATAQKGAALLPPRRGRARRRTSHARHKMERKSASAKSVAEFSAFNCGLPRPKAKAHENAYSRKCAPTSADCAAKTRTRMAVAEGVSVKTDHGTSLTSLFGAHTPCATPLQR